MLLFYLLYCDLYTQSASYKYIYISICCVYIYINIYACVYIHINNIDISIYIFIYINMNKEYTAGENKSVTWKMCMLQLIQCISQRYHR